MALAAQQIWVGRSFFVWVSVFNLFIVAIFWAFMTDIFNTDQDKWLFAFIAVGGTLGGIVGGAAAALVVKKIGRLNLLFVSAILLKLAACCVRFFRLSSSGPMRPLFRLAEVRSFRKHAHNFSADFPHRPAAEMAWSWHNHRPSPGRQRDRVFDDGLDALALAARSLPDAASRKQLRRVPAVREVLPPSCGSRTNTKPRASSTRLSIAPATRSVWSCPLLTWLSLGLTGISFVAVPLAALWCGLSLWLSRKQGALTREREGQAV